MVTLATFYTSQPNLLGTQTNMEDENNDNDFLEEDIFEERLGRRG